MAYMRPISHRCQASGCKKTAMFEVLGRLNESYGRYCEAHAKVRLKRLASEAAETRRT